jgi:SNF2 family DNA or RNA helicase
MSGTLIKNDPGKELQGLLTVYGILNLMKPLWLFKKEVLGMELEEMWLRGRMITHYGPPSTDPYYLDKTREFLRSINYSRKLRSEVMDIPDKVRQVVNVTKFKYSKADTKVLGGDIDEDNYFALCHKTALRKVKSPDFKAWFLDTIDKSVVFYRHNDVRDVLCDYLEGEAIAYTWVAGGLSDRQTKANVDSFQKGSIEVIFIYLDKTEGLTCTAANNEIFVELPDTIKALSQAEDRLFRFGLDHPGTVYFPVDYNGAESRKLEILRTKAVYIKSLEKNNNESTLERDVLNMPEESEGE